MDEEERVPNEPDIIPARCFKGKRHNSRFKAPEPTPERSISMRDIVRATKSLKQNICVDMLMEGCHRSFEIFFRVLDRDKDQRGDAEPLEQQPEKMNAIKEHLINAEKASRSGSWSVWCEQLLSLGLFFSSQEDVWLRLHFLHIVVDAEQGRSQSSRASDQGRGQSCRAAAEARVLLAETYLQQGEPQVALQHTELCLSEGFPLKDKAQQTLCGIYMSLGDEQLGSKHHDEATELLLRALSSASDSGSKEMEGGATFRVGVAYQLAGDHSTAKQYLNTSLEICQELKDNSGIGKVYRAMAQSFKSEGNMEEMVLCLRKVTDQSNNSLPHDQILAGLSLGAHYQNTGDMEQAVQCYSKAFELANNLDDEALVQETQWAMGQARALSMEGRFRSLLVSASTSGSALEALIKWKDGREPFENVPKINSDL